MISLTTAMIDWVIYLSEDCCESLLTGINNLDCGPQLMTCTEGKPMRQVMQFEATDYDAAIIVRDQWMNEHRWDLEQAHLKRQLAL